MQNDEVIERLTRVETKLDSFLPLVKEHEDALNRHGLRFSDIENDISFMKKVVGIVGSGITVIVSGIATYLGLKH